MGDVTITRGQGFLDDIFDIANWQVDSGVTRSSDGDILSVSGTSGTNGAFRDFVSINTTTYPKILIRAKADIARNLDFEAGYTVGSPSTFTMALTTSYQTFLFTLPSGKTVNHIEFNNQSSAGANNIDFILVFKETLTIPMIGQPLQQGFERIQAILSVLDREGQIIQDLGSQSPEVLIQGVLVTTTTPNNYTAAQWWNILEGLMLEASGDVWQWLSSDNVNYKYLPAALNRIQPVVRSDYGEFTLRLRRWDVLSQTADRLGYSY